MNRTKCLVIFPPQWSPFSPHLAPAAISAVIRKAGHICDVSDLNIDFYFEVLKKDFLKKALDNALNEIEIIKDELRGVIQPGKTSSDYSSEIKIKGKKLLYLNEIKTKGSEEINKIIDNTESAVQLLHDKNAFYHLPLASNAVKIINTALKVISLDEFPQEFSLYYLKNSIVKLDWSHISEYCAKDNVFSRFYKDKIDGILNKGYDCIGISLSASSQFFSALVLAKMLKEKAGNTKIFFGGNHISRITDALKNHPDFFKVFADYVIYEEGERGVIELIEHLNGRRNIEDISSLLWLDGSGTVRRNEKKDPLCLSELAIADLEGFPIEKYFLPEIIMPVRLSRGCYWKKCTFCDHFFGQTYNVKDIDIFINELRTFQTKYGINNFEFTDDCISPAYLKAFSEKVIESGLKINWYCDLRLENALTREILELANKAGLKMVLWGFEAGSKRVMELINKGIDIDNRFEILDRAAKAGIFNFAYTFMGFPTETYDEAMETIDALCKYADIIHAYGTGGFTLGKHSLINDNPEKFGIRKLPDDEEFSTEARFELLNGLKSENIEELEKICITRSLAERQSPVWMFLHYRELLFLYIVRYGRDAVLKMKYNNNAVQKV